MENLSINQQLIKIQDRLLSFAYSLTEGRDEAEDLLQETSLRVLDNQEYYKENTNFLSWSFTVMKNIFLNNRLKMSRRYGVVSNNYDLYQLTTPSYVGNPDETLDLEEITKKIESLPQDLKQIFLMFTSGYKYEEISVILDIPVGTVKSRLFKARAILQTLLKEHSYKKKLKEKKQNGQESFNDSVIHGATIVATEISTMRQLNLDNMKAS